MLISSEKKILVTGATGYIGARLVPRLLEAGYKVRAVSRSLEKLKGCHWANHSNVELMAADVLEYDSLAAACSGCSVAYYLVHSMNPKHKDFAEADRLAAASMVKAAKENGLERIIYLGGLGEQTEQLSHHLRSRAEVADILQAGEVPVTVLRAAMIIGSGSASFEILRYLVDRLPFMITPRWVRTPSQPIAVRNVLHYLIGCLEKDETKGQTFDIGGPEVLTYQRLMDTYAEEAGLHARLVIPVPYFTPRLSSYWIHLVTPVPSYIARPLAEGLRNPAFCQETRIREIIPQELLDCRSAIRLALECMERQKVESHWTDAGAIPPAEWSQAADPAWAGGTIYEDSRSIVVDASADQLWEPLSKIGGKTGWYCGDWLWKLRGIMDRLVGGVGLNRGRRHVSDLRPGDAIDWWRVSAVEPGKHLVLVAEMKLPGKALLEFRIDEIEPRKVKLTQTAKFLPYGLSGIIYWWLVTPLHNFIFGGMLRGIADAALKQGKPTERGKKMKLKLTLALASVAALGVGAAITKEALAKYEEPSYKVLVKKGELELREYPPVLAAEVTVDGRGEKSANQAFSILAGYIFGKNQAKTKIAMTVPVTEAVASEKIAMTVPVTQQNSADKMTMRFFMPSNYSLESLPQAKDSRIKFVELPKAKFAVIRFSGVATESGFSKRNKELMAFLEASGLKPTGEPLRAFYNPPWTLPFMRRNELWIPIES